MTGCALYEGWVRHRRFEPVRHELRRRLFLPLLDLDELPAALDATRLWSARGPAPARFRRSDYLPGAAGSLADAARDLVAARTGERPDGPVRLLAHVRTLGTCFNPIALYFCHRAGEPDAPAAVLAEVTNTPWGDRHAYVLPATDGRVAAHRMDKRLHVSPFMAMSPRYECWVTPPGRELVVHVASRDGGRTVFDATLSLRRRAWSPAAADRALLRHPLMPQRVLASIYAEAARLRVKGARWHRRPAATPAEAGAA